MEYSLIKKLLFPVLIFGLLFSSPCYAKKGIGLAHIFIALSVKGIERHEAKSLAARMIKDEKYINTPRMKQIINKNNRLLKNSSNFTEQERDNLKRLNSQSGVYNQTPINNGHWLNKDGSPGIRGNSIWHSNNSKVASIQPNGTRFIMNNPDFKGENSIRIPIQNMTGNNKNDVSMAKKIISHTLGLKQSEVNSAFSKYALHHINENELELVEKDLHKYTSHSGGALNIRNKP